MYIEYIFVTETEKKFMKTQIKGFKPINKVYLRKLFDLDSISKENKLLYYAYNSDTVDCLNVDSITILNLVQVCTLF